MAAAWFMLKPRVMNLHVTASVLALALTACGGSTTQPDQDCTGAKCDDLTLDLPSCLELGATSLTTTVFASSERDDVFYYLPSRFAVRRIESNLPALINGTHGFSDADLATSPYYSEHRVGLELRLLPDESPEEIARALEAELEVASADVRALRLVPDDRDNPLALTLATANQDDLVGVTTSLAEGGFSAEVTLADQDAHLAFMSFLRHRAGVLTVLYEASFDCAGDDGETVTRDLNPQSAHVVYESEGIELGNQPRVFEESLEVMNDYYVLRLKSEWAEDAYGEVFDVAAPEVATREIMRATLAFDDDLMSVEDVNEAGRESMAILRDAYAAAFADEVPDVEAHLEALADQPFGQHDQEVMAVDYSVGFLYRRLRLLAGYQPSVRIEPFDDAK